MPRTKRVDITGDITHTTATELHALLSPAVAAPQVRLSLPEDVHIDLTGLQLLAAFVAERRSRGLPLELDGEPLLERFDAMARFCGLPTNWRTP